MNRLLALALPVATLATATLATATPAYADPATWEIDASHSAAQFSVRHLMVSTVRGHLGKVTGAVTWDGKDPATAAIDATVDIHGINTREEKRDAHLKSPDFFDAAKFPTLTFKSKRVTKTGADAAKITGDLTMHGVTKEVVLSATFTPSLKDPWGNLKMGATATGSISRKDFGLTWNKSLDSGGVVVGDKVEIVLDVELGKKPPAQAAAR